MSQVVYDTIDPNTTSGTQLASILDDFKDAMISTQSGASRPSEIDAGGKWLKIVSATQWEMYMYDGADDILLYTVNPTDNNVTYPKSANQTGVTRISGDSIGPIFDFLKRRDAGATLTGDELGVINFKGYDGTTEYTQASIKSVSLDDTSVAEQGADIIFQTTPVDGNSLTEKVRIKGSGKVGLGTSAPAKNLHVRGIDADSGLKLVRDQDGVTGGAESAIVKKRGVTNNGQTLSGDIVGKRSFYGIDQNGAEVLLAEIEAETTQNTTDTAQGTKLTIRTKQTDSTTLQDAILVESGKVTILGQELNDSKTSASLLDDTVTRNLFSIDGATYKAFSAKAHIWGVDTIGPTKRAQLVNVEGVYDGTAWHLTWDDKDLAGNGLLVELSVTNAATLVVDYVNQIASGDFDTGNIYLEIVRKK